MSVTGQYDVILKAKHCFATDSNRRDTTSKVRLPDTERTETMIARLAILTTPPAWLVQAMCCGAPAIYLLYALWVAWKSRGGEQ